MEWIIHPLDPRRRRLPVCEARHDVRPEEGLFYCTDPRVLTPGNLVSTSTCRSCPAVRLGPPSYYLSVEIKPSMETHGMCKHLGKSVGMRECSTCRGRVLQKTFACFHPNHEITTLRECMNCIDYEPPARHQSVSEDGETDA